MGWGCRGCCKTPTAKSEGSLLLDDGEDSCISPRDQFTLAVELGVVFVWYVASATFLKFVETISWLDAFYCCSAVISTVGYGDVTTTTTVGKAGMIVIMLSCGVIVTTAMGRMILRMAAAAKRRRIQGGEQDLLRVYKQDFINGVLTLLITIVIGAIFVECVERYTWLDAFYWATYTATAVGFGDLTLGPTSRAFAVFYMPISVIAFASAAAALVALLLQYDTTRRLSSFVRRGVTYSMIKQIDKDGDGTIDKFEFVSFLLVGQGKLQPEDVSFAVALFDSLDTDKSGTLDTSDILAKRNAALSGTTPPLKALDVPKKGADAV